MPKHKKKTKKAVAQDAKLRRGFERSVAKDYFSNAIARMGYGTASLSEGTQYEMIRLSNDYYLLLTLYRNHWIARRVVDLPAQDMTRAWPKLQCEISPDDIAKFDRTINRTYTPLQIRTALKWARLYGGAGALMAIKGHEDILDEPLDLDDVNPGSYMGLIPFDRWVGVSPEGPPSETYMQPVDWGLPEYYECRGPDTSETFRVHSSRILRFTGPSVPTPELQAQIYWGISVLELIYEELRKRDNASWSILSLLFRANLIARVEPELASVLSGLGTSQTALKQWHARMQAQNEMISNQSMMVMGKDSKMESLQYSFSGIGDVYQQFQMDIAGAAEIPVTRLFGRTITGLGQANDADERYYEEMIATKQNEELRPQLDKLYPVIAMSEFGEVPDDLDYTFPSIRVLTEEEKADLVEKGSAPVLAAYNAGVISQRVAVKELKQLGDTTNIFTNITDEDVDEADDQPLSMSEIEGSGGESGESESGSNTGEKEEARKAGEEGPGAEAKQGPEAAAAKKSQSNPARLLKKASSGAEDSAIDGLSKSLLKNLGVSNSGKSKPETIIRNHYNDLLRAWSKSGRKQTFKEFVELVDPARAKQILEYSRNKGKDSAYYYTPTKHVDWHGMQVAIENEAGTVRAGKSKDGKEWQVTLSHDYGELLGTVGRDGDAIDVFMGLAPTAEYVYVVHTMKPPTFMEGDEDKVFLNFSSQLDARMAFFANFDRPEHFGSLEELLVDTFIEKALSTKEAPAKITA